MGFWHWHLYHDKPKVITHPFCVYCSNFPLNCLKLNSSLVFYSLTTTAAATTSICEFGAQDITSPEVAIGR